MAKSPFELRFNALELARAHLMEKFNANMELVRMNASLGQNPALIKLPDYPTTEDIITTALLFKSFVD